MRTALKVVVIVTGLLTPLLCVPALAQPKPIAGYEKPPTYIYLDFGLGYECTNVVEKVCVEREFDIDAIPEHRDFNLPDPTYYHPTSAFSYLDTMHRLQIDYNRDGIVNREDLQSLAESVASLVRRTYEPFNVKVVIVAPRNWTDIQTLLSQRETSDTLVMFTPTITNGWFGLSGSVDYPNNQDDVAYVYLQSASGTPFSRNPDLAALVVDIAAVAAEEIAHSFGLYHILEEDDVTVGMLIANGFFDRTEHIPLMYGRGRDFETDAGFESQAFQDPYRILVDAVGIAADAPEYVLGTGEADRIDIKALGFGIAEVTVNILQTPAPNCEENVSNVVREKWSYTIDTARGVLVEAGAGNDLVCIGAGVDADLILRGGSGDDRLTGGTGNDVLQGDMGSDTLIGGRGDDVYVFGLGSRDLGRDVVIEERDEGADTVHFANVREAVTVDLGRLYSFQPIANGPEAELFVNFSMSENIEHIVGSAFDDRLTGNRVANILEGGPGNDVLFGGEGDDELFGDSGKDYLLGQAGADLLEGGFDNELDWLEGGSGGDRFVEYHVTATITTREGVRQVTYLAEAEAIVDFASGDEIATVDVTGE